MKFIIFDDAVIMGIHFADNSVGAVVHHSLAVVNLAQELFTHYWRGATDPSTAAATSSGEIMPQELGRSALPNRTLYL